MQFGRGKSHRTAAIFPRNTGDSDTECRKDGIARWAIQIGGVGINPVLVFPGPIPV
jgi:hypothetical protein